MLSFLSPNAAQLREAINAKANAEREVQRLNKRIESMKEDERLAAKERTKRQEEKARQDEEEKYELGRQHKKELDEAQDQLESAKKAAADAKADLERERKRFEKEREADEEHFYATVNARVEELTRAAKDEARREVESELADSWNFANEAHSEASEFKGENAGLKETIAAQAEQLKNYSEFVKVVLAKIPEVDLSSFNINVDVPTPEVVVNNHGNKSGK